MNPHQEETRTKRILEHATVGIPITITSTLYVFREVKTILPPSNEETVTTYWIINNTTEFELGEGTGEIPRTFYGTKEKLQENIVHRLSLRDGEGEILIPAVWLKEQILIPAFQKTIKKTT